MKAWTLFVVSVTRQKEWSTCTSYHESRNLFIVCALYVSMPPRMLTVKLMLKLTLELTLRLARGADAEADAMLKLAVADGAAK